MSSTGRFDGDRLGSQLDSRIRERSNLLQRTVTLLEEDARIRAAWLTGSLSRDDHDALSDVDLWIVVSDEFIGEVVEGRQQFVSRLETPVLVLENMTNAPPSGAYLLVHYPGVVGPQHFDWFWQPESLAHYPSNGKLLFDRANLAIVDGSEWQEEMHQTGDRPPIDETDVPSLLVQKNAFFWAMSLIVAKYIARQDAETVGRMMNLVARTLSETSQLLKVPAIESNKFLAAESRSLTPKEQLETLRRLAQVSKDLQPEIARRSQALPTGAIDQIVTFFKLTSDMVTQA